MMNPYRHMELLAPAGSMTCLHAAVAAGADAVYLGCDAFNARRSADNFTLDDLARACDFAHLRGVRVYLTLNIAIMPDEISAALELARQAWRRGVDALIVQDIGLAAEVRRALPDVRLHISTQMNTHNIDGVRAAAEFGAERVTLARELSCAELAEVTEEAHSLNMETECFAHGALCICYSGQCLMSSMIGGRSANRGTCAQACRLPYTLCDEDSDAELSAPGDRLLSPKDLCTIDMLSKLAETGVDSLKIEGRMKSPEYVFAVVAAYRAAIDRLACAIDEGTSLEEAGATEEEHRALSEAFSRGFTEAYLSRRRGNDIMGYGRPNNRGVFAGRVTKAKGREVAVESQTELHEGDVLEFWTNKGHFASTLEAFERKGDTYYFEIDGRVGKGDRVFRVRDASMAFHDDDLEPRLPARMHVVAHIGEPLRFVAECAGVQASFEGATVEAARTKAITPEEVREHVDRLGNTPFFLTDLDVDVDEGVGMGFSALHKARTQALKMLAEAMLDPWRDRIIEKNEKPEHGRAMSKPTADNACVVAFATNPACARAAKKAGADVVFVAALNYRRGEACCEGRIVDEEQAGYPGRCAIALPVVDKLPMNSEEAVDLWKWAKPEKPLFVENLGQLVRGANMGSLVEVGPHLPITNAASLSVAAALGARRVWLSPELSLKQIAELGKDSPVELGIVVCGNQELMTCEHCLLMSQGACNQKCSQCKRRAHAHTLLDRKGYRFPVVTDCFGRSHLYNAVRFDAAHVVDELIDAGVSAFMVDTTLMSTNEAGKATSRVVRAIEAAKRGTNVAKAEGCTTGHLFRGVQ